MNQADDETRRDANSRSDSESSALPARYSCLRMVFSWILFVPLIVFLATFFAGAHWLFELICSFQFQIFCGILISTLLFGVMRSWKGLIPAALMLLVSFCTTFQLYLPFHKTPDPIHDVESLKICSFNVLHDNEQFSKVIDLVNETEPDILILIEFTTRWQDHLVELEERYPYRITNPRRLGSGIAIYSRVELLDSRIFQLTRNVHDCPMIRTRVRLGDQDVSLFAVHTLSPRFPEYMDIRNRQYHELVEIINDYQGHKIVAGDFNATTWSPHLKSLVQNTRLHDSRQGYGLNSTWPAGIWMLRVPIDHIFVSDQVAVHSRSTSRLPGSDHMAITGEFSVAAESD